MHAKEKIPSLGFKDMGQNSTVGPLGAEIGGGIDRIILIARRQGKGANL